MSHTPRVNVVIVTYNNPNMLRQALHDLAEQTLQPARIVVVDNSDTTDARAMVAEVFPPVEYRRSGQNTGSAGGYAEGFAAALTDAEFLLALDDDLRLERRCIEELVRGFERLSSLHKLGAVRSTGYEHPHPQPSRDPSPSWGGTMYSAGAIREIGLPRADYFMYGEDAEFALRLSRHGYTCWSIPTAKCPTSRDVRRSGTVLGMRVRAYPSAFRLYYAFRNEISMFLQYRMYARAVRTLLYAAKVALFLLTSGGGRDRGLVIALSQGLADGVRGRLGRNLRYQAG
jgi:GT2 family glycosyltransferase